MTDTPTSADTVSDPNPEQSALLAARIRRMMLISSVTTGVAIAAVLGVIGYRLFRTDGSVATSDLTTTLPKGARIVSTAVSADRLVVTIDVSGVPEVRTFDIRTLKPAGRLTFANER